jgi:hypothetical protein
MNSGDIYIYIEYFYYTWCIYYTVYAGPKPPNHPWTAQDQTFHFRNLSSSYIKNQSPNNCNPKHPERILPHPRIRQPPHAVPPPPPHGAPPPPPVPSTAVTHRGTTSSGSSRIRWFSRSPAWHSTPAVGSLRRHRDLPMPLTEAPSRADPPASGDSAAAPRGSTATTVTCRGCPPRRPPRPSTDPSAHSLNNGLGHRIYGFQKGMML